MESRLDLSSELFPKTIIAEVSAIKDTYKVSKLDDYVNKLEDEMRKIEAFKRELPLCMLLLNYAIERLKEESRQWKDLKDQNSLIQEFFMPLKKNSEDENGGKLGLGNDVGDKKDWMSSAQLWTTNCNFNIHPTQKPKQISEEDDKSVPENPLIKEWSCEKKGREFEHDLKGQPGFDPSLSLITPFSEHGSANRDPKMKKTGQMKPQNQQFSTRKQRRCWSPELHRHFVAALELLGGSQVATPKQIIEEMKIEGLTNDEVKSHLQKYRLHVRKLTPSTSQIDNISTSRGRRPKSSISQSVSPQGPFHAGGSSKGLSTTEGESIGIEEDEKSSVDEYSWKGRFIKLGGSVDI